MCCYDALLLRTARVAVYDASGLREHCGSTDKTQLVGLMWIKRLPGASSGLETTGVIDIVFQYCLSDLTSPRMSPENIS